MRHKRTEETLFENYMTPKDFREKVLNKLWSVKTIYKWVKMGMPSEWMHGKILIRWKEAEIWVHRNHKIKGLAIATKE